MDEVQAHEQDDTVRERVLYPEHVQRTESAAFRDNKHILVKKLRLGCWVCGTREKLEVHHLHEWALWPKLDAEKVLEFLRCFDPYGFSRHMGEAPVESPDDIRNLLVLCEEHHRGVDTGVHKLTYPIWLPQRAVKPGEEITAE